MTCILDRCGSHEMHFDLSYLYQWKLTPHCNDDSFRIFRNLNFPIFVFFLPWKLLKVKATEKNHCYHESSEFQIRANKCKSQRFVIASTWNDERRHSLGRYRLYNCSFIYVTLTCVTNRFIIRQPWKSAYTNLPFQNRNEWIKIHFIAIDAHLYWKDTLFLYDINMQFWFIFFFQIKNDFNLIFLRGKKTVALLKC